MSAEPSPGQPARRHWGWRVFRAAAWIVGVLAVLAGLTAAFLPGYLKGVALDQIRVQLDREATIESISVNPLLLTVRVRGLTILQADGKSELIGFDELRTRIGVQSLRHRALVIEKLTVERLRIHLARLEPERYNFSDIVQRILARSSSPEFPRFELNSLAINDAEITFDDKPVGKVHRIEKANILLPELSSFVEERAEFAEPRVTAIFNGQPLEFRGRTKPFHNSLETTVDLHFTNLDLPTYVAYSPVRFPLRLERGRLSSEIDIAFLRAADKGLSVTVKGLLKLEDLILRDPEAPSGAVPMASVRAIEARIAEIRWPENSIKLDQLAIAAPQVLLRRDPGGRFNWHEIFTRGPGAPPVLAPARAAAPPVPSPAAASTQPASRPAAADAQAGSVAPAQPVAAPPAAILFKIAAAEITEGTAQFDDLAAPGGPFHATLKSIDIRARGLSNVEGAQATIESSLVTDAGESHANTATLALNPFGVTGEQSVKRIRLGRYQPYFGGVLAADIEGTADAKARYAVDAGFNVKVSDGSLNVDKFAIRKARTEFARIGSLEMTGGTFDLGERSIVLGSIALRQCRAGIARDAQGGWNFEALLKHATPIGAAPGTAAKAPAPALAAPETTGGAVPDWSVAVGRATLERCAVQFDDGAAARGAAASIVLDPITARVDGWSSRPKSMARIDLSTRVNGAGQVAVRGTAGLAPPAADVDLSVEGLDLVPFQPYIADRLDIRLTSGAVAARGKLSLGLTNTFTARYRGEAGLARLATTTKADGEDFLNWGALQARGLDVAVNSPAPGGGAAVPLAVTLEELALSDFYSRLIVNADGTLNLQHVLRAPGAQDSSASAQDAAAVAGATTSRAAAIRTGKGAPTPATAPAFPAASRPPPVTISRVTLSAGRVYFSDRFIKPNYSANLVAVEGVVSGLSSDFASRASVDIRARYDPSAPVEVKGTINPLRGNLFLDLAANVRDVELVPFTPYSQKYAGYGITKGKLSFKVKYLIEDRKLTAENTLLLDQLTFGDKVESPDATKLPVLFAVALLKNARGEIDLNLPVSGSLDDPQFSVFSIVVKIIGNLLAKAVTAPFALIGAMFGGGEDLAFVDFPAGLADTFAPGQEEKLAKIAKALADRPGLKLDIAGRADPLADGDALKRRALQRRVAALLQEEQQAQGQAGASAQTLVIPPADYPRLLKRAYDAENFDKPKPLAGAPTEPSVADMERLMLANITVGPDALRELGMARAGAAKDYLARAGVAGERMFIVAGAADASAAGAGRGPRVDFSLK